MSEETASEAQSTSVDVRASLGTALWAGLDWTDPNADNPAPLDDSYNVDDVSPEALAELTRDLTDFTEANAADLADLDPAQVAHDFYLTRNHHGAGFWDRGLGDAGDRLTTAAHVYGTSELYPGDDGLLYVSH